MKKLDFNEEWLVGDQVVTPSNNYTVLKDMRLKFSLPKGSDKMLVQFRSIDGKDIPKDSPLYTDKLSAIEFKRYCLDNRLLKVESINL